MEIRARIALQVSQFKANAKIVSAQFKAMTSSAERFQKNVDHYAKRSLQTHQRTAQERKQVEDKIGAAIAAQVRKRANDEYSTRMQYVRKFLQDKSRAELEAARRGSSGVVAPVTPRGGVRRAPNVEQGVFRVQEREAQIAAGRIQKVFTESTNRVRNGFVKLGATVGEAISNGSNRAARSFTQVSSQANRTKHDISAMVKEFNGREFEQNAAVMRHAIGDISRRVFALGAAMTAAFVVAVKAAADFESAFTSVERTSQLVGVEAEGLRRTLLNMAREIPVAFEDITKVATLGAQLGIAAQDLDQFTESVIKFSALSGISADQVGLSFGRLAQLMRVPISEIENLSSAIAFAGINAVATDREILSMGESIAAAASLAGFSADQTLGFATALASLKVRPEEARGVFTRLFKTFDIEASRAGTRMDDFAKTVGLAKDEAIALVKSDPSEFFKRFLTGANAAGKLNESMLALGITNTRELNVLIRLAENMDVVEKALSDTSEQFEAGTFAAEAFALVADDLNSKFQTLKNSMEELFADMGGTMVGPLKGIVDAVQGLVNGLVDAPRPIRVLLGVIAALTAAIAIFAGAVGLTIAGLLAIKIAFRATGDESIKAGLGINTLRALLISLIPAAGGASTVTGALTAQFRAVQSGATGASFAVRAFTTALPAIGLILTAITAVGIAMGNAKHSAEEAKQALIDAAGGIAAISQAIALDSAAGDGISRTVKQIENLTKEQKEARLETAQKRLEDSKAREEMLKTKIQLSNNEEAISEATKALEEQRAKTEEARVAIESLNEGLVESTVLLGQNTTELMVNALAKASISELGGDNIFRAFRQLDPGSQALLESFGVDIAGMIKKGLESGSTAEEFVTEFVFAIQDMSSAWYTAEEAFELTKERLIKIGLEVEDDALRGLIQELDTGEIVIDTTALINTLIPIARAVDDMGDEFLQAAGDSEAMETALKSLGIVVGDLDAEVVDFNNVLKETVNLLTSQDIAEQKVAEAFARLAEGAKETSGEIEGLGESARTNMSNFASFMDAAVQASIAAGEGTEGAIKRMVDGFDALEREGIDSSQMFERFKIFAINNIVPIGEAWDGLRRELMTAGSMQGMRDMVDAFYRARLAARGFSIDIINEWNAAVAALSGMGSAYSSNMSRISGSSGKTQTALEKLQEKLAGVFKWINTTISTQNSISALGEALQKNGLVFSAWSEGGRDNINAVLSTIDALAIKSGGDLDKFANDLASLREALVLMGVPASGLKYIDDALAAIGKTGKSSKRDVNRFMKELTKTAEAENALRKLQDALAGVFKWINNTIMVQNSMAALGKSLQENGRTFSSWSQAGRDNVSALLSTIDVLATKSGGDLQKFANDLASLRAALVLMGVPASGLKYIDNALAEIGLTGKVSSTSVNRFMNELKDTSEAERAILRLANAVKTLQSGISAGLAANFAFQRSIDDVTLGWLDMEEAAQTARDAIDSAQKSIRNAKQAIDDANASIKGLAADKNKLEYQLQIAIKYGDTLRANQLRADIAKIDADIAQEQNRIADSQESIEKSYQDIRAAESSLGINSGTRDIIERNRALQDMAGLYGDVAANMLINAKPGEDLNAIIDEQVEAFRQNAIAMGYTEEEANAVADVLREELIVAMNNIPEDIHTNVNVETDEALEEIDEFVEEAEEAVPDEITTEVNVKTDKALSSIKGFAAEATRIINAIPRQITTVHTTVSRTVVEPAPGSGGSRGGGGGPSGGGVMMASRGGLITGPGSGTSDSIAARLSNGEYVIKAAAVQRYGVDFFDSLNQMRSAPSRVSIANIPGGSGEQMVYLSPEDRQLLRAAIDRPIELYTDNATIARSANAGNQVLAQRGLN